MKNYFIGMRGIIKETLIQCGSTTWTIDNNDLPTDESMDIFCDSLIEMKRVNWEVEGGSVLSRGMLKVTFTVETWEKPPRPLIFALRPENRPPQAITSFSPLQRHCQMKEKRETFDFVIDESVTQFLYSIYFLSNKLIHYSSAFTIVLPVELASILLIILDERILLGGGVAWMTALSRWHHYRPVNLAAAIFNGGDRVLFL